MAFDRNNQADLLALKNEVNNDPIGMGYAAVITQTNNLLRLLNDPANNVGGETVARDFTVEAMLDALLPTELDNAQTNANAADYTHMLLNFGTEKSIETYKTKWRDMFAGNSATVTALDAQTKALSRAEVLFGVDAILTRDDWAAARIA